MDGIQSLGPWAAYAGNPVLSPDANAPGWDSKRVGDPYVWWDGTRWIMLYYGASSISSTPVCEGIAASLDLTNWVKWQGNPVQLPNFMSLGAPTTQTGGSTIRASLVFSNSIPYLLCDDIGSNFWACVPSGGPGIGALTNILYVRTGATTPPPAGTIPNLDVFSGPASQPHGIQLSDTGVSSMILYEDSSAAKLGSEGLPFEVFVSGSYSGTEITGSDSYVWMETALARTLEHSTGPSVAPTAILQMP